MVRGVVRARAAAAGISEHGLFAIWCFSALYAVCTAMSFSAEASAAVAFRQRP